MPNRLIKETIRTSKKVNSLPDHLFRFWVYLITYVDDYGRGSADPELLNSFVFPRRKGLTDEEIGEALHELERYGMIRIYHADGEAFFCFPNWNKHQQVRAKKSRFPAPDISGNQMKSDDSICPRNPIQSNTNPNPNPMRDIRARAREEEQDDGFQEFWAAYPRKSGDIRSAYMEYMRVTETVSPEELIAAITDQTDGVSAEDLHYLPSAEKWLRNCGWESKASLKSQKTGGGKKPSQIMRAADYKPPKNDISPKELEALIDKI